MNAFLTGSRVYGNIKPSSDVDLVIRVSSELANILRMLSDDKSTDTNTKFAKPVRFGKLNLILCETDEEYVAWFMGTNKMKLSGNKFEKTEAKGVLDEFRDILNILDKSDSGDRK